jgi:gliding motility-associated-like protein
MSLILEKLKKEAGLIINKLMKILLTSILLLLSIFTFSQCNDTIISPNAFTPTMSTNSEFYPTYINSYTSYKLSIYNRWGMLVFVGDKWNGLYNGNLCERGVYLYEVVAYGSECSKIFYGTVSLIR